MATKTKKRVRKAPSRSNVNEHGQILEEEEEEVEFSSNGTFDVSKYTVGNSPYEITLYVGKDEDELNLTVQDMSWSKRNRILSDCLNWDLNGNTNFDGDAYVRLCLKEIIKEAPWGNTTEAFLIRITDDLGQVLEKLVPRAFAENDMESEIQSVKKEL